MQNRNFFGSYYYDYFFMEGNRFFGCTEKVLVL